MPGIGNGIGVNFYRKSNISPHPTNVVITTITGGNRITFTSVAGTQTEIWASIDGAAYVLLTTLNIGVETYDHTGLYATIVDYKLRSKLITLNAPLNLTSEIITGTGVELNVDVNNDDALYIEYWGKIDAGDYALLETVAVSGSTSTYTHTIQDATVEYKVRAKNTEFFSGYSNTTTETVPLFDSEGEVVIKAGNTVGWYDFTDASLMTAVAGVQSIAWDKIYGKQGDLGAEMSSGVIELYAIYKITATTTNFFYTGCQVGDTFCCRVAKTCDANNRVQRYTGNHLGTFADANCPTNGVFNGTNSFMKTAPFTYNQPAFIYMVFRQVTWTNIDYILAGATASSPYVQQYPTTPKLIFSAGGAYPENANLAVNTWGIARILYNGASSKFIIDKTTPVTGSVGTLAMGGFTLGCGGGNANWGNIEVKEVVLRNIADSSGDETKIFNYLATKYGMATI